MRALILIGTACLALAACGDRAPDQNAIEVDNATTVETVPSDDGNWVPVNTDELNQARETPPCAEDRHCTEAQVGPNVT